MLLIDVSALFISELAMVYLSGYFLVFRFVSLEMQSRIEPVILLGF